MPLKTRILAGRYVVERPLGRGGMAEVYEGFDPVLSRTVAIKVLAPQHAHDRAFVARFRREARAAAALNHPGVVSVYDTGSEDSVHFIVMERVEGRPLADVIANEGPLDTTRAEPTAHALDAADPLTALFRDLGRLAADLVSEGKLVPKDGDEGDGGLRKILD